MSRTASCAPPNQRLERTGEQPCYFMRTTVAAGRSTAGRSAEEARRMTKPAVYLETSVVGYATSRPSRDLVVAGHQQITREWFARRAEGYDLFVSQLVASEASGGDEEAARERAAFLQGIRRLGITDGAGELAAKLVESGLCPGKPRKTPFKSR